MEKLTTAEILEALGGRLLNGYIDSNVEFSGVCTDSRKLEKDNIFLALKGDNFNGNNFVSSACNSGAAMAIVDEVSFDEKSLTDDFIVIAVEDCRLALLSLGKLYRSKLTVKIIGITGSTGKTSTKDITAAVLSGALKVFKTAGNFNNEIGLPLMLFKLDNSYDAAVLEMGMSDLGEIHRLADTARPHIALISNIGLSHIENLKTQENILKAKLEITDFFKGDNVLILNGEDKLLSEVNSTDFAVIKTGVGESYDFNAINVSLSEGCVSFELFEKGNTKLESFTLQLTGRHNVLNALLAIACARELGLTADEMRAGLLNIEKTSMRLDIVKSKKFTIIDDCYNASPDSMFAALDVAADMKCNKKIAVLGTMRELGDSSLSAHYSVGVYAAKCNFDVVVGMGQYSEAYGEGFLKGNSSKFFVKLESFEEVTSFLKGIVCTEDLVLVKASRYMKFENIVTILKNMND